MLGHFSEGDARRIARFVKQNEGKSGIRRSRPRRRAIQGTSPKIIGVTNGPIEFGNSGEITIYESPEPGQPAVAVMIADPDNPDGDRIPQTETVWFDWIAEDNPEAIEENTDVAAEIAEHGAYRIYHAACGPRTR